MTGLELNVLGCAVLDSGGLFSALVGCAGQYCAVLSVHTGLLPVHTVVVPNVMSSYRADSLH